ncbi:MAG: UDP-N-acetylmuramate--L-alanine ligase [Gammaproteobacteria bacterium]|nr:MAG: UDP-N-acetylmuramate--L-alanine ligase [Gammaproteobacteria bacterium]
MKKINRIHFIGIGGIGMSGIAEVMQNQGYDVSGSDQSSNDNVKQLREIGCDISIGHDEKNIKDADVVVVSSAINDQNPEIRAAKDKGVPIVPRAEMLSELMRFKNGIAVSGTHGKTTTTSMIAHMLDCANLSPTYVIGGRLRKNDKNAHLGDGEYFVVEADESDGSFLYFHPTISIVTNIDHDHLGVYENRFDNLVAAFKRFISDVPFYGCSVLCVEDETIRQLLPEIHRRVYTYGYDESATLSCGDIRQGNSGIEFSIKSEQFEINTILKLGVFGDYNALNALACICVGLELGIEKDVIFSSLQSFSGISRRFNIYTINLDEKRKITVIDDYGHHPTEMASVISSLRNLYPDRRIVFVFEPHRYSRVSALFDDFVETLSLADYRLILPVYPAGEEMISGASTADLCAALRDMGVNNTHGVHEVSSLFRVLDGMLENNDVLLMMGAGSAGSIAADFLSEYSGGAG